MGLSGGYSIIKYLIFVFNFIFFLMGCTVLGLGLWLKVEKGDYIEISKLNYLTASNLAIAIGCIILVIGFLGCCGAITEHGVMLLVFFVLLLIVFIFEMTAGGLAYAKRGDIDDKLKTSFNDSIIKEYGQKGEEGVTKAIDKFQEHFECCGYNNFTDYVHSRYYFDKRVIPSSCCMAMYRDNNTLCGPPDPTLLQLYWRRGCYKEVVKFLKDNLLYIGASTIAFGVIQILGLVFSMTLYCKIRSEQGGRLA